MMVFLFYFILGSFAFIGTVDFITYIIRYIEGVKENKEEEQLEKEKERAYRIADIVEHKIMRRISTSREYTDKQFEDIKKDLEYIKDREADIIGAVEK